MELSGKAAIVTGGAVRLGRAFTLALARAGCKVCLHYSRSCASAEETSRAAGALGAQIVAVQADFTRPAEAARTVFQAARDAFGDVDVLVNSAAIFEPDRLIDVTEEHFDRHVNINLKAPFFLCREFALHHVSGRPGHIVNIADWRAERPGTGYLVYTLSKAALVAMTKSLAQELAPDIRVNAIAPGSILPPPGKTEADLAELVGQIPLGRFGSPEHLADVLLFLLNSDFITGAVIHVTGGQEL